MSSTRSSIATINTQLAQASVEETVPASATPVMPVVEASARLTQQIHSNSPYAANFNACNSLNII
jgi:hypothetical protein